VNLNHRRAGTTILPLYATILLSLLAVSMWPRSETSEARVKPRLRGFERVQDSITSSPPEAAVDRHVPGFSRTLLPWRDQMEALVRINFNGVAIDQLGVQLSANRRARKIMTWGGLLVGDGRGP